MGNHFNAALTDIDSPEDILQENICMVSVQLKLRTEKDKSKKRHRRVHKSWSSPCGTSPGRKSWPARRCTLSPCKPAPGWSRQRSSSDGGSASLPAACPRTLEEEFMSQMVHSQQTPHSFQLELVCLRRFSCLAGKKASTCADLV